MSPWYRATSFPPLDEGEFYVCDVSAPVCWAPGEIGKVAGLRELPDAPTRSSSPRRAGRSGPPSCR